MLHRQYDLFAGRNAHRRTVPLDQGCTSLQPLTVKNRPAAPATAEWSPSPPRLQLVRGDDPVCMPRPLVRENRGPSLQQPLQISVVSVNRNHADCIGRCLQSVAHQNYPHVEHVLVDQGSDDDSLSVLLAQRERLTIVFGQQRDSKFESWNRGLNHCTGDVVGFLDARGAYCGPMLLNQIAQAFSDPALTAVYGNVNLRDPTRGNHEARKLPAGEWSRQRVKEGWVPPIQALFVRREWLQRINGFSPEFSLAADYAALRRLCGMHGFTAKYLDIPVVEQATPRSPWRNPLQHLRLTQEKLRILKTLRQEKEGTARLTLPQMLSCLTASDTQKDHP